LEDLTKVEVFEVGTIRSKPKRYLYFETYPISNAHVSGDPKPAVSFELKLFGFEKVKVLFGRVMVTRFTSAFYKRRRGQAARKLYSSEAQIQRSPLTTDKEDAVEQFLKMEQERYAPIGYAMNTQGLTILIPRDEVQEDETQGVLNATPLVSLVQALKRATCIIAECELTEFSIDFEVQDQYIAFNLYDSRAGGNGISEIIKDDLQGEKRLPKLVISFANCNSCHDFCDRCLLLSRTPPFFLSKGLLDRQELKKLISA